MKLERLAIGLAFLGTFISAMAVLAWIEAQPPAPYPPCAFEPNGCLVNQNQTTTNTQTPTATSTPKPYLTNNHTWICDTSEAAAKVDKMYYKAGILAAATQAMQSGCNTVESGQVLHEIETRVWSGVVHVSVGSVTQVGWIGILQLD